MIYRIAIGLMVLLQLLSLEVQAQKDTTILLIARNTGKKIMPDNNTIRTFGFARSLSENPGVPGPTIEVNEGDSVHLDLWNVSQGAPHTIHLHGLDVDQQNDGVPHLSFEVEHMQHGFYHFKAPHAGTYLYHCHVVSSIHVQAGMYGLLIIHPEDGSNTTWSGGYSYHNELPLVFSEIDTNWHTDDVLLHAHDSTHVQIPIPHFEPQFFMVNGHAEHQIADSALALKVPANSTNYLRLANIGYCGNRIIFPPGLNTEIISSDGRPLPQTIQQDTVDVFPGERYGVLCKPTAELSDSIRVEYINMNTLSVKGIEHVPVEIIGFLGQQEQDATHSAKLEILPNPFNTVGKVRLTLWESAYVDLQIWNSTGTYKGTIVSNVLNAGVFEFQIETLVQISGVYFVRLEVDGHPIIVKKAVKL